MSGSLAQEAQLLGAGGWVQSGALQDIEVSQEALSVPSPGNAAHGAAEQGGTAVRARPCALVLAQGIEAGEAIPGGLPPRHKGKGPLSRMSRGGKFHATSLTVS